jgi:hypothetical protein
MAMLRSESRNGEIYAYESASVGLHTARETRPGEDKEKPERGHML